jgi:dolichol-phosphate mannosyltransferase
VLPSPKKILIGIATYKERENLAPLIREIHQFAPEVDILVTDDKSPDGTGELADQLAAADPRIHVNHRAGKLGLGTAILEGMRYAIAHGYDYFITMDADFSHHPRYLPAMIFGMNNHDVMIGSRYVPGGGTANWPLSRQAMSRGVNFMARLLLRLPARDCSGGFRCYRVAKLREANFDHLLSRGYSFQQEALYRCRRAGCKVGETPIIFEDRRAGSSKVNPHEAARSISVIMLLGLQTIFGFDKVHREKSPC